MARPVSWFRLYRGKVWHLGWADDVAACGSERPADAEHVGERAPVNARVCGDCMGSTLHMYSMAQAAQMGDPRKTFDPWAAGEALIAAEDGVVDAEIVEDDEWPCGSCGHPNLDHDIDNGRCTVTDDSPAAEHAECPCRGLQMAV